MDYLKKKNMHKLDKNISINPNTHVYSIQNDKNKYTSVTRFIHTLFPVFNANLIINKMMRSIHWPNSKYYGKTKNQIKNIWEKNRKDSVDKGIMLHHDIEAFYNNVEVKNNTIEFKSLFFKFHNDHKHLIPYRTEMMIYDPVLRLAGTVDMIFKDKNGDYFIFDWKRSKKIQKENIYKDYCIHPLISQIPNTNYWRYVLQLYIYKYILENNYNMKIKDMYIVSFHPDNVDTYYKYRIFNRYVSEKLKDILT